MSRSITADAQPGRWRRLLPPGQGSVAYRWAVAARVLAVIVPGYLLISLLTALLGLLLPGPRAEAVLTATMLSFTFYAGLVIWAFTARSARRVCWALSFAAGLVGAALLLAQRFA